MPLGTHFESSKAPKTENHPNVHPWKNGCKNCDPITQHNTTQQNKGNNLLVRAKTRPSLKITASQGGQMQKSTGHRIPCIGERKDRPGNWSTVREIRTLVVWGGWWWWEFPGKGPDGDAPGPDWAGGRVGRHNGQKAFMLNSVPSKIHVHLETQNMTLLGNRSKGLCRCNKLE